MPIISALIVQQRAQLCTFSSYNSPWVLRQTARAETKQYAQIPIKTEPTSHQQTIVDMKIDIMNQII